MDLKGKIVFSSGKAGDYDIWRLDLSTKDLKQLTSGSYMNDSPKWSPDGKRIIFVSNRSGTPEIWMMNEDGSEQKRITTTDRWHNTPAWSPDGEEIVFCANYDENVNIYTMNLDGSELRQITDHEEMDFAAQYSPDGNKLIFTSQRSGNDDIWTYDIESTELTQLTSYEHKDSSPAYSPDNSLIAFVCGEVKGAGEENLEIYLMDKEGENRRKITRNSGIDRYVGWSPEGKYLIHTSSRPRSIEERLMVIDIETMRRNKLDFDRKSLDAEIDSKPKGIGLFAFLPENLQRKFYPQSYFGMERYPDWKL
jgi:TolB protein